MCRLRTVTLFTLDLEECYNEIWNLRILYANIILLKGKKDNRYPKYLYKSNSDLKTILKTT